MTRRRRFHDSIDPQQRLRMLDNKGRGKWLQVGEEARPRLLNGDMKRKSRDRRPPNAYPGNRHSSFMGKQVSKTAVTKSGHKAFIYSSAKNSSG